MPASCKVSLDLLSQHLYREARRGNSRVSIIAARWSDICFLLLVCIIVCIVAHLPGSVDRSNRWVPDSSSRAHDVSTKPFSRGIRGDLLLKRNQHSRKLCRVVFSERIQHSQFRRHVCCVWASGTITITRSIVKVSLWAEVLSELLSVCCLWQEPVALGGLLMGGSFRSRITIERVSLQVTCRLPLWVLLLSESC